MKALLLLFSCLVVLATGCAGGSDVTNSPDNFGPGPDTSAASNQGAEATSTGQASDSKVVITTALDLKVPNVRDAYTGIASTVRGLGGYVAEGRIADSARDSASLRLRVPATRHEELLASLRNMSGAKVAGESSNAKEVTAEYTDLEAQIRNLQRSESQYQELMGRAGSITDVVQVSAKLDDVRGRIETAQGRLKVLSDTTDYATVNVALMPAAAATSGLTRPLEVFEAAAAATKTAFLLAVSGTIVVLVLLAWTLPVGLSALFVWRTCGRRLKAIGARLTSW